MKTNINIFNNLNESLDRELDRKRKTKEVIKSKKEKKLTEAEWKIILDNSIRKAIKEENLEGIIESLKHYNEVIQNSPKADDFIKEEFQRFIDDYEMDFEDLFADDNPEEVLDYILSEFYDLCDNTGVFIEIGEAEETKSNDKLTEATVIWDSEPTFDSEEDAEDYDYDLWLEDFNLNVLPDIKNQCRNDILVMAGTVGRWNGNFGGGTVIDVDDLLGIEDVDSVRLISDNGNIVWEGSHHDGTHSMGLYTVPNDLEARKKIVYDLGIIDWLKDMYDYDSEEYCVEDALDRLDSIGDLKDMLTPEDYAKVPEYFTPIKVTGNMPQIKESEELKEDNSNVSDLAKEIYDFYDNDMGTHFDEVLGNEEEVYNETLAMLENKEDNKEVIQKLIDEIRESNEDLANRLESYLNESSINESEDEYEAAKYKGKEWGIFAKKSNAWVVFGTEKEMKERAKELNKKAKEDLKEEDIIKINQTDTEPDYLIQDVTVLNQVGDGDVQSPDIEALLTLVDSELKENYSENWGRIKTLSSKIDENTSYALVDISTPEILKELDSRGIKDAAIGKNLILEKVNDKLVEFKVNNLNGTTKYSKKTTNPQQAIYEWIESEFLQEAKEEKAKETEVTRIKTEKETVENYINNRLDLKMEIENIKMFIELSKEVKAQEEMKPAIQKRMYTFAAEVPHNIEVTNTDDKYELSFSTLDDVVTIVFGKEWVKEVTPDNEVVGVIKESQKINEGYEQFNIGEIEVVFNPDTYETLYSIPSADVQDKKINLTKVPTVDTPYDTDTIIKSYIETRFGRIPTEEEKEMIDNGEVSEPQPEESEPAPESPEIPQEEEIPQDDINIDEPDLTEDELPDEPEENEVPDEVEPEEEESPEAETGSAVFMKVRPKQEVSIETLRNKQLEGDTPTSSYIVVDTIDLMNAEFEELSNDLSQPKSWLEGLQAIDRKNYSFNVIKATNANSNYDILIDPLGYNYPRYVAIIDK